MTTEGLLDTGERRDRVGVGGLISMGGSIVNFRICRGAAEFGQNEQTPGASEAEVFMRTATKQNGEAA
jgi:hypothetical protein